MSKISSQSPVHFGTPVASASGFSRRTRLGAALVVVGTGLAAAMLSLLLHGHARPATSPALQRPQAAHTGGSDLYGRYFGDKSHDELRRRAFAGDSSAALALGHALAEQAQAQDDLRLVSMAAMWLDRARQQGEADALVELAALFARFCDRSELHDHPLCDPGE